MSGDDAPKPRVALIDYETVAHNPVGSVHREVVAGLCDDIDFVVFATRFDNPRPDRVRWARIPAIRRPLILLFLTFHVSVAVRLLWERAVRRHRFDVIQSIESASLVADVVHAQFCHRWFLHRLWRNSRAPGWRGLVRGLFERAAALLEPAVFSRAQLVVAPSAGTVRALVEEFPGVAPKARLAYNGIDLQRHARPVDLDLAVLRHQLGLAPERLVLVFVALGHFERKGLPLVLDALEGATGVDLVVVGGTEVATAPYRRLAAERLPGRAHFVGFTSDVRPYLWAADAFVLPSSFEGFPFVALEAAAAGLPLLCTAVNGVEEILVDGVTGYRLERSAASVAQAIARLAALDEEARQEMARQSASSVQRFSTESMVAAWRAVYEERFEQQRWGRGASCERHRQRG